MKRTECTDPFLRGYLDCALFTTDQDDPGDCDYIECGRADDMFPRIPNEFIEQARLDCSKFEVENAELLAKAGDADRNGMDFWYTRNGHGVGFWDRDYEDGVGTGLTLASKQFGEVYLDLLPPSDYELLTECIDHWERLATNTHGINEAPVSECCACCQQYNTQESLASCHGCPIFKHTGKDSCEDTPYKAAFFEWDHSIRKQSPEFLEAARKELEFLKKVRDELQ